MLYIENFKIKKENTAISTGTSIGTKYIALKVNKNIKILDYGAGKLRNSTYLFENGFKDITLIDSKEQIAKWDNLKYNFDKIYSIEEVEFINESYDYILCSYVLNVIPDYKERANVLTNIEKLLDKNGLAVIEVRGENSLNSVKYKEDYLDGYIIGTGKVRTFQKPYNDYDIIDFIHKESNLKPYILKSSKDSISLICIK